MKEHRESEKKSAIGLFLIFPGLILLITVTIIILCFYYLHLPGPLATKTTIIIEQRLSITEITGKLEREQVIYYPNLYKLISKIYSYYHPLKSGEYEFKAAITPREILKILTNGKSIIHKLSIPEGWTVDEIINKVNSEPRLLGTIDRDIPEGYLMPSTYFYTYGEKRQDIINKMYNKMNSELDAVMVQLPQTSPLKTGLEILILASIIEKEAVNDSEKPKIAAVFINRLNKGMKLQADPTSIYALTKGKYRLNRLLTKKDLKLESPYNTYYISGLPGGAICCPGRSSLEAAVNPANIDALYFVLNENGLHSFANNLAEHNLNVQKYRSFLNKKEQIKKE